jgi:hypothetical protein
MAVNKSNRLFFPAVRLFSSLYGLVFGVLAYAAPNFFFGPNGVFPKTFYKTTCLESNDLDPITIHCLRYASVEVITLCLGHLFLFDNENFVRCSRALNRLAFICYSSFFIHHVAIILGPSGTFYKTSIAIFAGIDLVFALFFQWFLKELPASDTALLVAPTRIQRIANIVTGIFAGIFCVARSVSGASHTFVPRTPLENNEFDSNMMGAARLFGLSLFPAVFAALVEGNNVPKFIIKMSSLYGILMLPVLFMAVHDTSGYFNQEAFTALTIVYVLYVMLQFYAAGAFGGAGTRKSMPTKKSVKTKAA